MSNRQVFRVTALAITVLYLLLVAVNAALKAYTPFLDAVTWTEIAYGPAITVLSSCLLYFAAFRAESWIRRRGRRHDEIGNNELQGDSNLMVNKGVVSIGSNYPYAETIQRFLSRFAEKGLTVFATIDHQAAAQTVGLTMHPATVIIFGNPRAGTPLMLANPRIALELPMKILIHEPVSGQVEVLHTAAAEIVARHPLPPELASKLAYADQLIKDVLQPIANT